MTIHDAFIRIAAKHIVAPIVQRQGKGQKGHLQRSKNLNKYSYYTIFIDHAHTHFVNSHGK